MSKHSVFKTVQLVLTILLSVAVMVLLLSNAEVYHQAASDYVTRLLCIALWVTMGLSFVFLFLDFSFFLSYRKSYRQMDYALRADPVSGIANRFSCDMMLEQYLDKPLPENMGCIMIDITNIREVNRLYGHMRGNLLIADFAGILNAASNGLCFVGRNGGNKFLAVFENTTSTKMMTFLGRIKEKVAAYNGNVNNGTIEYRYGLAFHEDSEIEDITQLIALANSRIYPEQ